MSPSEAQQRILALRAEVARHDELYYRRATPEIADYDYDRLKRELADLEARFPTPAAAAGAETPTARVGDDRSEGFVRAKHRQAMTTLDNTYDEGELRDFHARLAKALGTEDLASIASMSAAQAIAFLADPTKPGAMNPAAAAALVDAWTAAQQLSITFYITETTHKWSRDTGYQLTVRFRDFTLGI